MELSIVIPVYNEKEFIEEIVNRVKNLSVDTEIIVVDDHSTDGTDEILKKIKGITVLRNEKNVGKGFSVRRGIAEAKGEYTIIQDADLEYSPEDIPLLLKKAKRTGAEAVYGSRFKGKGKFLLHSLFANRVLTLLTDALFGGNITDMETCYKLVKTDILKKLNLKGNSFDIEPEITAKLLRLGCRIEEVPIHYHGRTVEQGKKIHWKDAVIAVITLLKVWVL